jgi:hypothetical protein
MNDQEKRQYLTSNPGVMELEWGEWIAINHQGEGDAIAHLSDGDLDEVIQTLDELNTVWYTG